MINLTVTKSSNKNYLFPKVCNLIRFFITIENSGNETAHRMTIRNTLSKDSYFIPGSLYINGEKQIKSCSISSIHVNSLAPGENISINYDIEFNDKCTIDTIQNKVIINYFDSNNNRYSITNNDLVIPIIRLDICVSKTVDRKYAYVGDTISYLIIIRNCGNIPIDKVILYDDLPPYLLLLPASVLLNGEPQYLESFVGGLPIGTIKPNTSVIISFNVQILNTIDTCDIFNTAKIEYGYTILDGTFINNSIGESTSDTTCTKILE